MIEFFLKQTIEQASSFEGLERSLEILLGSGCRIWTEDDGSRILLETRARVDQVHGLKIQIFAKEHSPPHFHVSSPDIDASFAIQSGALIRGKIDKKDEELVLWWYLRAKPKLIRIWNETRPTDCPVGPIKE